MSYCPERDVDKIAKGWSIAMIYSKERLRKIDKLEDTRLDEAVREGRLVLETTCLFIHACVKRGQYVLPLDFWRVLHAEYGIVVYPSAMTEDIEPAGLGIDKTFTEAYAGHVVMFGRSNGTVHPPRCPFEYLQEPPPVYERHES